MPKVTAILPMRSGSQRVKNKNLRVLADKPLFEFVLTTLSKVPQFEKIVVDSNSDEILEAVGSLGLSRVVLAKRPDELAQPETSMVKVLARLSDLFPSEWYFQTHSTSPFLTPETIESAIRETIEGGHDSGFGVSQMQMRLWSIDGEPINHDPKLLLPTQDLSPINIENSSFYIYRGHQLFDHGTRYGARPLLIPIPLVESIDIDDEQDFKLAELVRLGQLAGESD